MPSNTPVLSSAHRASEKDLATLRGARVIRTAHLLFSYKLGGKDAIVACSVAKKVAKRAVDRNRLKRQCRAALKEVIDSLPPLVGIVRIMNARTEWIDFKREIEEIAAGFKK